jgi:hypothetical protein
MRMYYQFVEGKVNYINYESDKHMSFYKDPKDALGYVVVFDNVEKDKALEIGLENNIKQIDRYKLGKEIQVSK